MPPRVWGGRSKTNGLIGKAIKEPDIDFSHFVREQEMGLQKRWVAGLDLSANTKTNTKTKTNQCGERCPVQIWALECFGLPFSAGDTFGTLG